MALRTLVISARLRAKKPQQFAALLQVGHVLLVHHLQLLGPALFAL